MIRVFILALVALNLLASCASDGAYHPITKQEKAEFSNDRIDVYPNDVRRDLDRYTNTAVVWVGVIRGTDAHEEDVSGKIHASTSFDQHYFDWVEDKDKLQVSQRGEGRFRTEWLMRKLDPDANAAEAEKFAGKNRLAIVYGVPESVDPDGTVVLKYRYLRVLGRSEFTTNQMSYGRLGEKLGMSASAK